MTSRELESVFSSIELNHNGTPVEEIRWLLKTCEYQYKVGNRWQGLPNAVVWTVRNRIYDHYSQKIKVQNQRFKNGKVTPSTWKAEVGHLLLDSEWFQDFILSGGLCPNHRGLCIEMLEDFDFVHKYEQSARKNNRKLESLLVRVSKREFGLSFEYGDFDKEVTDLVRSASWMIALEQDKRVK